MESGPRQTARVPLAPEAGVAGMTKLSSISEQREERSGTGEGASTQGALGEAFSNQFFLPREHVAVVAIIAFRVAVPQEMESPVNGQTKDFLLHVNGQLGRLSLGFYEPYIDIPK